MFTWRKRNDPAEPGQTPENDASTSDAELVRAARRGDKRAFVEIVARHQAMVCGIALGILGDFAASEDAGQEAFLSAWRKFHELREPERLRPWLAQIVRNTALGHLRRRRGHEPLENALVLPDQTPAPDEQAANEDEAALVRLFLAKLPEDYRLPLVLFYSDGQSVRGVAEVLGISEDAVKQRLSRGREMLRERMSGLLETVLTRSRPTAIFTMTLAAAIGALTAPVAVAGSVFTATSTAASTAAASASPSASLFTAMTTSKTFLVATTALIAVAFIPVGYHISASKSSVGKDAVRSGEAPVTGPTKPSTPSFESSALFAEWRGLHETHGTNAAAMPALYQAIAELKDPLRRRAFHTALIAEWVQVDAAGGLTFYLGKGPDNSQRRQFIEEWLALDPRAATDALLAANSGWEPAARDCLSEIARRAPSRLPEIVARFPKQENSWNTGIRDAFAIAADSNLEIARKSVEAMTGPNREQALAGVAMAWAKRDLNGAIAWARTLPEETDRDEIIRAALLGRATVDPIAALESVGLVPPGGRSTHFASTTGARVLAEAAQTDFDATLAWVVAHPGRIGRDEMQGLSEVVTERMNADSAKFLESCLAGGSLSTLLPAIENALINSAGGERAAVWDWLKTQGNDETLRKLKQGVLNAAGYQDPALGFQMVADLPRTPEGDALVESLASALLNGGSRLDRFNEFYRQAPERLQQPLIDSAFGFLRADNLDDPQKWIARLSLVPETSRPNAVASIAGAWAAKAPEEAVGWIASLPPGEARSGGASAIAAKWAFKDAHATAEWIAAMPPGAERDRSTKSFVAVVAEKSPWEAWNWALSIGNAAERNSAATEAAKAMASRDPAAARQWIETGPFTPETKAELQAALTRPTR